MVANQVDIQVDIMHGMVKQVESYVTYLSKP